VKIVRPIPIRRRVAGKERISRKKFIGLGAALGLGSVGASVIAGCRGDGGSAGNGETTTVDGGGSTSAGRPEVGKGQAIARESEVTPEAAFPFTDANTGRPGVLVRLEGGELTAYSAVCTHQACTVGYRPEAQKLACPCHGSVFDPARGAAVENGPASSPLSLLEIEVREGEVFLA
jgi:Rieske Fe-S protein